MLGSVLGILTGLLDPVAKITNSITDSRLQTMRAQTDQERIAAEERTKALESRRDVLIAESGSRINRMIRAAIALGPTIYLLKIFIWDKVFQSITHGTTDPLDANLWAVVTAVLGFYFLSEAAINVTRIVKR